MQLVSSTSWGVYLYCGVPGSEVDRLTDGSCAICEVVITSMITPFNVGGARYWKW